MSYPGEFAKLILVRLHVGVKCCLQLNACIDFQILPAWKEATGECIMSIERYWSEKLQMTSLIFYWSDRNQFFCQFSQC